MQLNVRRMPVLAERVVRDDVLVWRGEGFDWPRVESPKIEPSGDDECGRAHCFARAIEALDTVFFAWPAVDRANGDVNAWIVNDEVVTPERLVIWDGPRRLAFC